MLMRMRWRSGLLGVSILIAACSGDGGGNDEGNDTSADSATPTGETGASETGASTSGSAPTSATGADATGSDPCFEVYPSHGQACDTPGAECSYGDDCGSWDYVCEDGVWVTIDASTCGEVPIACEDGPSDGDPCWGQEECDPDGDCRDVLQCESGIWTLRAVCSAEYCVGAEQGGVCDEIDRSCPYPCGPDAPVYRCTVDGWDGTNLAC
jgi:hypothetical protein